MDDDQGTQDVDFLEAMETLLEQHDYQQPEVGETRSAVVVALSSQGAIVDLGLKRDGIAPAADLDKLDSEARDELKVGAEIEVYVVNTDDPESLQVSVHMARLNDDWMKAQELLDSGEVLETRISGHNRGGVLVSFGGLRGFIPSSHLTFLRQGLDDEQRQEQMARSFGKIVPVKVIEVDRQRRRLVLSNREAERERQEKQRKELLATLAEGDVIKGRVSGWRDFGAFVDLGGADGLIHISELAWQRVNHPREVLKMGEELDVYVLNIDQKKERISLSRKRLLANPWSDADERYAVGQLVEGRIIRVVDYGAFVEIEPGIEGLLHASQLGSPTGDPSELLREGETHLLRVISVESSRQRMGLSLKAVTVTEQIDWMTARESQAAGEEALGNGLVIRDKNAPAGDESIIAAATAGDGEGDQKPGADAHASP